jgi:hypothetical protein
MVLFIWIMHICVHPRAFLTEFVDWELQSLIFIVT